MNCPPQITDALEVLDAERESLVWKIERIQKAHGNLYTMEDDAYHEMMGLHKKRDRLSNVTNNLRAFYDTD